MNVKGSDLKIENTDSISYLLTYSYPCQSLSKAGKMKGMQEGSGTKSSLVWEVGRILKECKELPQVLLMENVPEVMDNLNKVDFLKWRELLESMGYENNYTNIIATDCNFPQGRKRTFMVSTLNSRYEFNYKIPFTNCLNNYLEPFEEVDEKWFFSDEKVEKIKNWKSQQQPLDNFKTRDSLYCQTLTAREADENAGMIVIKEHDGRFRRLSTRETFRLMGIKDYYFDRLNLDDRAIRKIAGNAIVVDVLKAIIKEMI